MSVLIAVYINMRRKIIILLTIISTEFIVSSTNLQLVKNSSVPVKINRSDKLNVTLVRLGLLDTNPLKNKRVRSCKNSVLKKENKA